MQIHNKLKLLLECLERWETLPSREEFEKSYLNPLLPLLRPMLEDFTGRFRYSLYDALESLNWEQYRKEALLLSADTEEKRIKQHLAAVEKLFQFELQGEIVLFGAFTFMDGYARFDRGTHRVYLGVDESHNRGAYLDVLHTHELTHVAREAMACVWSGWGLDPKMDHDAFVENQPVAEHLFNEGFSCVVSEILTPGEPPWAYAYQTEDSLAQIIEHAPAIDKVVHAELKKTQEKANYGRLYNVSAYIPEMPRYAHYVWAWQWVKQLLKEVAGGDPKKLVGACSKDFVDHALRFKLQRLR